MLHPEPRAPEPLNVLMVEDSPDDALLIVRELRKAHFDVHHERVETASAMQAALAARAWDVIIADYALPQFNAEAALELVIRQGLDIPFLIVSGSVGEERAVALMRQGVTDYILKDRLHRLGEAVRRAVTSHRLSTRHQATERELRIKEWALDATLNPIALLELDGTVSYANAAFIELWGFARSQAVIGEHIAELVPYAADFVQHAKATLRTQDDYQVEFNTHKLNGTPMTLLVSASVIRDTDEAPSAIIITYIDLTERHRTENALLESETRFRQMAENIHEVFFLYDIETDAYLYISPAFDML
ncbi:MAG: PAS domain S-box protein, partial [Anaerolineales bacterium]